LFEHTERTQIMDVTTPPFFHESLAVLRTSKQPNYSQQRLHDLTVHLLKTEPLYGQPYFTKNVLSIWRHAANFVLRYSVSEPVTEAKQRMKQCVKPPPQTKAATTKTKQRIRFSGVKLDPKGSIEKAFAKASLS
jgi:hypothetical protein